MKKVTLDKHAIAAGLYWASLAGEKPSAEMSVMANEVDRPYGFTRKVVKEDGISSYQVALTDEKSLVGTVSGAAVIADKFSDIIFVEKLSAQEVWICAVADSEVMVGGDVVVNIVNAISEFERISENYKETPVFVFGESLSDVVDLDSLPDPDEVLSFGELLEKAGVSKLGKEFNSFKIGTTESKSKNILMGIAVVAILGGVGYTQLGDKLFSEKEIRAPQVDISNILTKNEKDSKDILDEAKKEEIQWLRGDFNVSDPIAVVRRILAFDIVQEKYINGWKAISLKYDAKHPKNIELQWSRSDIGTPLSLRMGIENAQTRAELNGKTATSTFTVVDKIDNGYSRDFDIVSYVKDSPYKHENMMHDLISMGYSWSMTPFDRGERPIRIQGLDRKHKKQENVRQLDLTTTSVFIQGKNRDQLSALIKIFEAAKTFKLNKVSISLDNETFQWRVEGVLYEN